MQFGVCLLNQGNPHFVGVFGPTENLSVFIFVHRDSVIDQDIDPAHILENSENVKASGSELVEDWWV